MSKFFELFGIVEVDDDVNLDDLINDFIEFLQLQGLTYGGFVKQFNPHEKERDCL